MSAAWSKVKLGEVLGLSDTSVPSSELGEVNLAGVYSFGRGLFARGPMLPSNTSYRSYNRLVVNDFVISQPKAWEGALARVTHDFDGWYLSPVFSTFRADSARLEPAFLDWFCKRNVVWTELQRNSRGIGARRETVSPETFLTLQIPLPPLSEQRQIVARIEELAAKIEEVKALRKQAAEEAGALYEISRDRLFRELDCMRELIADVFDLINGRAFKPEEWSETGRRIIRIQNLKYEDAPYNCYQGEVHPKHLVHNGDVLFAWSGQVVSLGAHIWRGEDAVLNQHIFNVRSRRELVPEFVKEGLNALVNEMKGQVRGLEMFHIRKQEIDKLLFTVPSLAEQHRIMGELDALRAEVDTLKRLQAETAAELDALLPSILDKAFKGEL